MTEIGERICWSALALSFSCRHPKATGLALGGCLLENLIARRMAYPTHGNHDESLLIVCKA